MDTVIAFAVIVLFIAVISWGTRARLRQQVDEARRQGRYPLPGQAPTMEHVFALAKAGQKIPAIKLYREIHRGAGLKEAKEAVERLLSEE
ncbi:MAG: ribosomal protein L7/L12 [Verrucomicrobiota bacterium]